jgi:hypothetical protein
MLPQKYEHLFDGTLGAFNTEPSSLQLMDPNCKQSQLRAYTVTLSVQQQLQYSKVNVRLIEIGVLDKDYSCEWTPYFPSFGFTKNNGTIRVFIDFN